MARVFTITIKATIPLPADPMELAAAIPKAKAIFDGCADDVKAMGGDYVEKVDIGNGPRKAKAGD